MCSPGSLKNGNVMLHHASLNIIRCLRSSRAQGRAAARTILAAAAVSRPSPAPACSVCHARPAGSEPLCCSMFVPRFSVCVLVSTPKAPIPPRLPQNPFQHPAPEVCACRPCARATQPLMARHEHLHARLCCHPSVQPTLSSQPPPLARPNDQKTHAKPARITAPSAWARAS